VNASFDDIPRCIFLDSSALQTLQSYGEFIYDNVDIDPGDRIHRDLAGVAKLEAFRWIMQVAQRAPFQFALSDNSFHEVIRRGDASYLQWAYEVLDHWHASREETPSPFGGVEIAAMIDSNAYSYLGAGDRALLKDALLLGCDSFLTMENKLPRNGDHIQRTLGLRVFSPAGFWELLRPWAALFY
jgi:hypothetical protein